MNSKLLLGLGALAVVIVIAHQNAALTPEQLAAAKARHRAM